MKLIPTTAELRQEVRDKLQCPAEYIKHLQRFGVFRDMKNAIQRDEPEAAREMLNDARESYRDFCHETGLNFDEDNRKARVGFFFYQT